MPNNIIFRMVAWTDAAGKCDPNLPLNGNEDNYYADDNLSDATPNHIVADEDIKLSGCGMVMAVADGMGGMNAGEIASQIAHDTVAEYFAPGKITPQLAATHENRSRYMEEVIRDADHRIKTDAHQNHEHEGMGSTLIMAWLVGNELSVTWIGDSRAYRFNPQRGIEALSKDHSYVQELADKGVITYEQTFEHPQGNIITRSLGDESKKAHPDSRKFKVYDGDIILLCSDGLSGVLRDRKIYNENGELCPGDNIEDIIREHSSSLKECREALWAAAERAEWYDNVTAILCEIRNGAGPYVANSNVSSENTPNPTQGKQVINKTIVVKISRKKFLFLLFLIFIIVVTGGIFLYNNEKPVISTPSTQSISNLPQIIQKNSPPADSTGIDSMKQKAQGKISDPIFPNSITKEKPKPKALKQVVNRQDSMQRQADSKKRDVQKNPPTHDKLTEINRPTNNSEQETLTPINNGDKK